MALGYVIFCATVAGVSGYLFGYDSGIITTTIAQEHYIDKFQPSAAINGAVVAILQAGAFFGCLLAGELSDRWGRKKAILFGCIFIVIGGALQAAAEHISMMIAGRLVIGFGVGSLTMTVPVYQAEIAPPRWRGLVMGTQQQMLSFGYISANWVGYGCSFVNSSLQWRMPLAIQVIPGIVLFGGAQFLPESPRWLVEQGHIDAAYEIVRKLHFNGSNEDFVQTEFQEITDQIRAEGETSVRSYREVFRKPSWRKRLLLGSGLWAMVTLTGINALNYYMTSFINALGFSGQKTLLLTGLYGSCGPIVCAIGILVLDKLSRKKPLILASVMQALSLAVLAAVTGAYPVRDGETTNKSAQAAGIAMLFMFSVFYSFSFGPLSWIYPAEIMPMQIRSIGYSMSSLVNWLANVLFNQLTPIGMERHGWKFYFFFMATNLVSAVVILFCYPETSGKTLEQIDEVFGDQIVDHVLDAKDRKTAVTHLEEPKE